MMLVALKNHKYVKQYFTKDHKSGIKSLTFCTHDKWINYHAYNYTMYIFGEHNNMETDQERADRIIEVPLKLEGRYIQTVLQDKDQITFYFIPVDLIR